MYLHPPPDPSGVRFSTADGGHRFQVVWRYEGDTSTVDLHGTITVARRISAEEADRQSLFRALRGRPIGGELQRRPGLHPERETGY